MGLVTAIATDLQGLVSAGNLTSLNAGGAGVEDAVGGSDAS